MKNPLQLLHSICTPRYKNHPIIHIFLFFRSEKSTEYSISGSKANLNVTTNEHLLPAPWKYRRRASTYNEAYLQRVNMNPLSSIPRKRSFSFHEHTIVNKSPSGKLGEKPSMKFERLESPSSSCSYSSFVEMSKNEPSQNPNEIEVTFSDSTKSSSTHNLDNSSNKPDQFEDKSHETSSTVVTWKSARRGSSAGMHIKIIIIFSNQLLA